MMSSSVFDILTLKIGKDLSSLVIDCFTDIDLTMENGDVVGINDEEFVNHSMAESVVHININKILTIGNNKIFCNYTNLKSIKGNPPIITITDLSHLFIYCKNLTDGNLNEWDVSKVTKMGGMFYGCSYNKPLSKWEVSNVEDMSSMFERSKYNQPLNDWDVRSVINMSGMFRNSCYNHNLDEWDVRMVKYTEHMFENSKFDHCLDMWELFSVSKTFNMFHRSDSLNVIIGDKQTSCIVQRPKIRTTDYDSEEYDEYEDYKYFSRYYPNYD